MNFFRPAGCSWQEWEELMREVQHHVRSMAGRALGCMHLLIRERLVVVAGLALVGIAPFSVAGNFPARPAEEQAAQGREPAVTPTASPQSGAAATPQAETKPPQVTYQDGQLTIVAENALLSEVMAAVRTVMGADIDLPPGVAAQRIWVRLGPGPARRVLRDLLDDTELNYVIQASESDTEGIRSVVLTVRSKSAEANNAGTQLARGPNRNAAQPLNSPEAPEPEASAPVAAVTPAAGAPPEAPPVPPAAQSAASNLPATPGNVDPAISRPPVVVGGGSDQMIQQLQSMYEQRRQLQMQQNQVQKPQAAN
jgi:hypothetical protein